MNGNFGTWAEVCAMSPLLRRAIYYRVAEANGNEVDWATGTVKRKRND